MGSCLVAGSPRHAADVAVVAGSAAAGGVIQLLAELAARNACQPAAEVVAVGLSVGRTTMQAFALKAAQIVVGIVGKGDLRTAV